MPHISTSVPRVWRKQQCNPAEIDEYKLGRRKYNQGRYTEGHWVFGGVERIMGNAFLVEVEKRDAETLLPIIEEYIR